MKKIVIAILAVSVLLLPSCRKDKTPDSAISIEVIVPDNTAADDAIFITGPFTGGEGFSVGNPQWKLARSGQKCTITLDPASFIGNYTLADGFYFVSEERGAELDSDGKAVLRTLKGRKGSYVVAKWTR